MTHDQIQAALKALYGDGGATIHYTLDGSQPTTDSPTYDPTATHKQFMKKCMENAYESMLISRRESLSEVDALLLAGWSFELPDIVNGTGGTTEPWQWYWRSPPKRAGSKGRRYLSTSQAFNALKRMTP